MYQEDLESQESKTFNTATLSKQELLQVNISPRLGFIRKVYGILTFQLILTVLLCILAMFSRKYYGFMQSSAGIAFLILAIIFSLVISIMLVCCKSMARSVPTNYILLTAFTFCEGYIVSYSCAAVDAKIVFMAAVMTLGITVALTVYAMTTSTDFTMCGGTLCVCVMTMLLIGIFMMFTSNPFLHVLYSGLGVILYGIYLIFDTQLIVGDKKHELSLDDYVLGALFLYLDIILLFLSLLDLLNSLKNT